MMEAKGELLPATQVLHAGPGEVLQRRDPALGCPQDQLAASELAALSTSPRGDPYPNVRLLKSTGNFGWLFASI